MKTIILMLLTTLVSSAQITASFSDQGKSVIKTITGHKPPKNLTLISINVCNDSPAQVTVSATRVLMNIGTQSKQKFTLIDPSVVALVLNTYGQTSTIAKLEALMKATTSSSAILIASKVISANAGIEVGLQLSNSVLDAFLPTFPSQANLIGIGQNLLQGDLVLSPLGCKSGLALAGTVTSLSNEQVSVK